MMCSAAAHAVNGLFRWIPRTPDVDGTIPSDEDTVRAVSQLAGNRSTSLFEGLRNQLGVDDLDISTDEKGRTSVSVGRYLNERTYFELQQGGEAGAKAIINLDVGRGVKLRGAAGGNGAGEAGIVYEHEY